MRTREKSKAELMRDMKAAQADTSKAWRAVNEARAERDNAIEEAKTMVLAMEAQEKNLNKLDQMYVSVTTRNTELEQQLQMTKEELRHCYLHRDSLITQLHRAENARNTAQKALQHQALGIGRLTEHMEQREVVSMTATDTSN